VPEAGNEHLAVHDERTLRGEDHVGGPGMGSISRTSWPRPTKVPESPFHWASPVCIEVGRSGSIHGLIEYVTSKYTGRHIRYRQEIPFAVRAPSVPTSYAAT
jgi:hypothetical protein